MAKRPPKQTYYERSEAYAKQVRWLKLSSRSKKAPRPG